MSGRLRELQQIYSRLASLEDQREELRINNLSTDHIDAELKHLRDLLEDIMNGVGHNPKQK